MSRKKPYISFVAGRYFRSRKKVGLVSVTSVITILATGLGAMAIIIAMSVMNGFRQMIFERTLDMEPDIRYYVKQYEPEFQDSLRQSIEINEHTAATAVVLERKLYLSSGKHQQLAFVKGIQPHEYSKVTDLSPYLMEGEYLTDDIQNTDFPEIILGISVANLLGVSPGDTVSCVNILNVTSYSPPTLECIVKDIFHVTVFDYDYRAYIHIQDMQYLIDDPGIHYIETELSAHADVEREKKFWQGILPKNMKIATWRDEHRDLFSAMEIEKYGTFIILNLVILLAGFNLISSLVMLLLEKKWEMGILQSMGATPKDSFSIYFRLGWVTGGLGMVIGTVLAVILMLLEQHFPFIPMPGGNDVYIFRFVPVVLKWQDVLLTVASISLLISLSSWLPARRASRIKPLKAIKSKQ